MKLNTLKISTELHFVKNEKNQDMEIVLIAIYLNEDILHSVQTKIFADMCFIIY